MAGLESLDRAITSRDTESWPDPAPTLHRTPFPPLLADKNVSEKHDTRTFSIKLLPDTLGFWSLTDPNLNIYPDAVTCVHGRAPPGAPRTPQRHAAARRRQPPSRPLGDGQGLWQQSPVQPRAAAPEAGHELGANRARRARRRRKISPSPSDPARSHKFTAFNNAPSRIS